jgi:phospholipid/cholesterol/gamma-HCH transport system substrate-binding protein
MRMTDAARVGLTVLVALAVLAVGTFSLRSIQNRRGTHDEKVSFTDAQGIQEGAYVRVRGVDVGTVNEIHLGPNYEAVLTLRISDRYPRIRPEDSVRIVGGLFGFDPPRVEITPGGRRTPAVRTAEGAHPGEGGPTTDRLISEGDRLLQNLNRLAGNMDRLTRNLNEVAGDPQLRKDLNTTARNFARASQSGVVVARNLEGTSGRVDALIDSFESTSSRLDRTLRQADRLFTSFQGTASESRELVRDTRGVMSEARGVVRDTGELVRSTNETVKNAGGLVSETRLFVAQNREKLQEVVNSLGSALKQLDATLTEARTFIADPEIRADLKATAANVREATENLKNIGADVRSITGDPKVQEDLRASISNLRDLSEQAGGIFRRIEAVFGSSGKTAKSIGERISDAEVDAALVRGVTSNRTRLDLNATIPWTENTFYRLGFYDFGENNRFNAQMGQQFRPGLWARYGIYASKLGVGLDVGSRLRPPFSLDIYGLDQPRVDLRGNIPVAPYIDATVGLDNITRGANPVVGLRYRK